MIYDELDLIDLNNVKDELVTVEGVYRRVSDEYVRAKIAELRASAVLDMAKDIADSRIRAEVEATGAKKPSEDAIKTMVRLEPDVRRCAETLRACEEDAITAKHRVDVVARRERVVTMLAALTKQEMQSFDV